MHADSEPEGAPSILEQADYATEYLETLEKSDHELTAAAYETAATALAERVSFVNERPSGSV